MSTVARYNLLHQLFYKKIIILVLQSDVVWPTTVLAIYVLPLLYNKSACHMCVFVCIVLMSSVYSLKNSRLTVEDSKVLSAKPFAGM